MSVYASDYVDETDDTAPPSAANDSDLEDTTFTVALERTGEEGGYHTSNDPQRPYQREVVTERRGSVDIRCISREVIHGKFGPQSDDFASLLVYDFHFNATKRFRRIASVNITFEFSSLVPGAPAPIVYTIAPLGRCSILPTTQDETCTREGEVKAEAGQMGMDLGVSHKWSKIVGRTTSNDTRVNGDTICNEYGYQIGVNWVLQENEEVRNGVPWRLRGAILLKRRQNDIFQGIFKIKVDADWKTEMTRLFGSKAKDDPILFDPDLQPTNKLRGEYDVENLGSIALEDICDITFQTNFDNAIKGDPRNGKIGTVNAHSDSSSENK